VICWLSISVLNHYIQAKTHVLLAEKRFEGAIPAFTWAKQRMMTTYRQNEDEFVNI